MKTVKPRLSGASPFAVCDDCYPALAWWVWIVAGTVPCFGTCQGCSDWFSVRELSGVVPGGRRGAPSGACRACRRPVAAGFRLAAHVRLHQTVE